MSWLLFLYPRAWRKRYGAEVAQLTSELIRQRDLTRLRAALDLLAGAGLAWAGVLNRPRAVDLAVRNAAFTPVVPGLGGIWLPGWLASRFHLFVIGYEERALRRRFGPAYLEYRHTVPRWVLRPPARG